MQTNKQTQLSLISLCWDVLYPLAWFDKVENKYYRSFRKLDQTLPKACGAEYRCSPSEPL